MNVDCEGRARFVAVLIDSHRVVASWRARGVLLAEKE